MPNSSPSGRGKFWLFGPVVLDPPTGDESLRLWDAVCTWLEFPYLFELQRQKNADAGKNTQFGNGSDFRCAKGSQAGCRG